MAIQQIANTDIQFGQNFSISSINSLASNFTLQTANTTAITVDTSQNVGIGVTPSAWRSVWDALQIGNQGSLTGRSDNQNVLKLSTNWYEDAASADRYIASSYATQYRQVSGQHVWLTAPSGTAAASFTFTQAMTLDPNGNLGIGQTNPAYKLDVQGTVTDANVSRFKPLVGSSASTVVLDVQAGDSSTLFKVLNNGNVGIGVTPSAWDSTWGKAMQIGAGASIVGPIGSNDVHVSSNAYYNGSAWTYIGTSAAANYWQNSGYHIWRITSSGTAANPITWTQAMILDPNGRLGLGVSPARVFDIRYGARTIQLAPNPNNTYYGSSLYLSGDVGQTEKAWMIGTHYSGGGTALVVEHSTNDMSYGADAGTLTYAEKMRITPSGQLLIGETSDSDTNRKLVAAGSSSDAVKMDVTNTNSNALIEIIAGGQTAYSLGGWANSAIIEGTTGTTGSNALVLSAYNGPMVFQTSGRTEYMRIDSTGNVGVGTGASPPEKFNVYKPTSGNISTFRVIDGTRNPGLWIAADATSGDVWLDASASSAVSGLSLSIYGTKRLTVDTNSNLKFNSGYGSVATAYGVRAWVNFNGSGTNATNQTINASGGMTSVYKNAASDFTFNFNFTMPDANYAVSGSAQADTGGAEGTGNAYVAIKRNAGALTTTSARLAMIQAAGGTIASLPLACVTFTR